MDALNLRKKVQALGLRAAQLQGMLAADREQHDQLTQDVALAKGRMGLSEEVGRVFDAMQLLAHQRSVGAFESLLSAVLNDVLPDEGVVRLITQYKNNATYLDLALEKNGGLEDIVDGNGGAVTNVICAGLRYAALSRTNNRRLMVLDEPDCWLKPDRVPFFVDVIAQVSRDMGAQSFFITHHDTAYFEGKVNLVKFFEDEHGKVHAQALAPLAQDWESAEQPGIRAIELINVRRHEHTFVPCFPGATAFIGDNNLGKSTAIGTALKAVAYGESDDSLIRHECAEASIILYLENNQKLEWSRSLKRSPSVLYKLYKGTEVVAEGRPKSRNQAPDWVTDVLGVCRVDELDLQIGNQKSPVFLLNDPAPRRAQILSVGRESSHLKSFMKLYENVKTKDRETVKGGELVLARLKAKLRYLVQAEPLAVALESLATKGEGILSELENKERLLQLESRLTASTAVVGTLNSQLAVLATVPEVPVLRDTDGLTLVTGRIEAGQRAATAAPVPQLPAIPELLDVASVLSMGLNLGQLKASLKAAPQELLAIPGMPELRDCLLLEKLISNMAFSAQAVILTTNEEWGAANEITTAQVELARIQEELGGECPLCGNNFHIASAEGVRAHVH